MRLLRVSAAALGLGLTIVPPVLFFMGEISQDLVKSTMLAGTLLWFFVVVPQRRRV